MSSTCPDMECSQATFQMVASAWGTWQKADGESMSRGVTGRELAWVPQSRAQYLDYPCRHVRIPSVHIAVARSPRRLPRQGRKPCPGSETNRGHPKKDLSNLKCFVIVQLSSTEGQETPGSNDLATTEFCEKPAKVHVVTEHV